MEFCFSNSSRHLTNNGSVFHFRHLHLILGAVTGDIEIVRVYYLFRLHLASNGLLKGFASKVRSKFIACFVFFSMITSRT